LKIYFSGEEKMKKILTILVLVTVIPACIFAGNIFGLTVGATAAYQKTIDDTKNNVESAEQFFKDLKVEDFKFGADVDVKVLILDFNAKGFVAKNAEEQTTLNGIVSANLAIDIFFVRVKAGLGYQYAYNTETQAFTFGNGEGVDSFEDVKDAQFDIYAGVDFKLGKIVLGAYATLPTGVSIEKNNWNELFPTIEDNWQKAQFGISVSYAFF
jgi:hypothetical protein